MEIMFEALAKAGEDLIERGFAGMSEGWVTDVVGKSEGFSEVFIDAKNTGGGTGELGDFKGVGEAIAEVIGDASGEDLGFGFETAEGAGVDNAITVSLEVVAEAGKALRKTTAQTSFHREAKLGQGTGPDHKDAGLFAGGCGQGAEQFDCRR
jgi:hypothetical protein